MGAGASSESGEGCAIKCKTIARTVVVSPSANSSISTPVVVAVGSSHSSPPRGATCSGADASFSSPTPSQIRRIGGADDDDDAILLSPLQLDKNVRSKWQIEEAIGKWVDLPEVTTRQIETSFLDDDKAFVTCTLNNRIATVDFQRLVLTFGSASPLSSDPSLSTSSSPLGTLGGASGGGGKRVRRVAEKGPYHNLLADPFAVAEDDVSEVPIITADGHHNTTDRSTSDDPLTELNNGVFTTELLSVMFAHKAPVFCSGFSADGAQILSSAKDGTMRYWEVTSSYLRKEFDVLEGSILSTTLCNGAPLAVSGADDSIVRIYSLDQSAPKALLHGHTHKVYGVGVTRDGRTIVSTSMDKSMRTWDMATQKNTRVVKCHESSIFSQRVSPLSPWLVLTASDDHTLASHDLRISSHGEGGASSASTVTRRFKGHTKTLWGCDIRFDEGQFISCGTDNCVMLWDPRNEKEPILKIASHRNPVHSVEYLPDGNYFLSSSRDMTFKITSTNNGGVTCLSTKAHAGHVYRATYCAATDTVMTCGADTHVKLWSLHRKL